MPQKSDDPRLMFAEPDEDLSFTEKLKKRFKNSPMMWGGASLGVGVLGYMLYGLKNRQQGQKLSVYLIHTRLAVQSTVIGMATCAMCYQIYLHHIAPYREISSKGGLVRVAHESKTEKK